MEDTESAKAKLEGIEGIDGNIDANDDIEIGGESSTKRTYRTWRRILNTLNVSFIRCSKMIRDIMLLY